MVPTHAQPYWVAPLHDQGIIQASGTEALKFLQGQLTNDIIALPPTQAQLTGYCSAKGRLLASFVTWKTNDQVLLMLPREIQLAVQKRLSMFILRAQVKLADITASSVILGIGGTAATAWLEQHFGALPAGDYARMHNTTGTLIRYPAAQQIPRWLLITDSSFAQQQIAAPHWVDSRYWGWTQIQAGIPQIQASTQEQFVPQMINFDAIGGVSFSKGCYPGQEVVARSHYLGKLKRRMAIAHIDAPAPAPGTDIFYQNAPCGLVVNAAPHPVSGSDLLVELSIELSVQGEIYLHNEGNPDGSPENSALQFMPLPYPIPDNARAAR